MFALYYLLIHPVLLILTTRFAVSTSLFSQPVINTSSGSISGFTQSIQLRDGNIILVDTFLGVPFAQPPIGALRFRTPVPVSSWAGMRNATQWPNTCWQAIDTSFGQIWGTFHLYMFLEQKTYTAFAYNPCLSEHRIIIFS